MTETSPSNSLGIGERKMIHEMEVSKRIVEATTEYQNDILYRKQPWESHYGHSSSF
jgi:hypothetical protein